MPEPSYNGKTLAEWLRFLADRRKHVRKFALDGLQEIGPDGAAAVPALIDVLRGAHADLREEAAKLLAKIGQPAKPALKALLGDDSETVRQGAITALGKIDPDDPDYRKHAPPAAAREDEDQAKQPAEAAKEGPINLSWIVPMVAITFVAFYRGPKLFELLMFYWGLLAYETLYHWVMAVAAWRRGFRVDTLSVGVGPTLARWRFRDADCSLQLIPFTGEVTWYAIAPRQPNDPYERLSLWHNVAFESLAMLSQIVVGVLILAASWWLGRSEPTYITGPAQIGWVRPGSAMEQAGPKPGDVIRTVSRNGRTSAIFTWRDAAWALTGVTEPVILEIQRGEQTMPVEVPLSRPALLDIDHEMPPKVVSVAGQSLASRVGIRPGDEIIAVDGKQPRHWLEVKHALFPPDGSTPTPHTLTLRRKDQTLEVKLLAVDLEKGKLGVQWKAERGPVISLGLFDGLMEALRETWGMYRLVFLLLTAQGECSSAYDREADETDIRRPFFIPPEGFSSRVPVMLGMIGVMLALYYLVSLPGVMALATVERIRQRSMPSWATDAVEWTTLIVVLGWVAIRVYL